MITCPHCGYANADGAAECLSCGFALEPPKESRSGTFRLVAIVAVLALFAALFLLAVRGFTRRADSMISSFGSRAYFDLGAGRIPLKPGEVRSFELTNPEKTPLCRLYGSVTGTSPGSAVMVLDSMNFKQLQDGGTYRMIWHRPIDGATRISTQTEGANKKHLVVFRNGSEREAVLELESLQAACYEKW